MLTQHCHALLEYPPSAIPWLILSHTSFLLCMVFNSCCTASSLHKTIKSLVYLENKFVMKMFKTRYILIKSLHVYKNINPSTTNN